MELTDGTRYNFFDSAANTTIPGAVVIAANDGALSGNVVYLLEVPGGPNDEVETLSIPFAAGEVFTLTYSELGDEYGQLLVGNGGTLQGITVIAIPEPGSIVLASTLAAWLALRCRSRARRQNRRTFA